MIRGKKNLLCFAAFFLCLFSLGFQPNCAFADSTDYIYGKNSSGLIIRVATSSIPEGIITRTNTVTISPDGAKLYGFNSENTIVYQSTNLIPSATSVGVNTTVSPDGLKLYGVSGNMQYLNTSSISVNTYIESVTTTTGNIVASNKYVFTNLKKQNVNSIYAGTLVKGGIPYYSIALSADGSKIFGFNSSGILIYQEVSTLNSGTVSTSYPFTISLDGNKIYGFNASSQFVYQNLTNVDDGTFSSNSKIFYVSSQYPSLSILAPAANQGFNESNTSFIPSISVSDSEGRNLTVKYTIEPEGNERETKTVTGSAVAQTVNFSAIDMNTITKGNHRITFEVNNGIHTTKLGFQITMNKNQPPTVLGTGTNDFTMKQSAVTTNGYKAFRTIYSNGFASSNRVTIYNPSFQKVNTIIPQFTDVDGNKYSFDYDYDGGNYHFGVLGRPDNKFVLFGQLDCTKSDGTKTSGIGYMIMTTTGQIIEAKYLSDKSGNISIGAFILGGSDPDGGILFGTGTTSLKYVDNDMNIIYSQEMSSSSISKLTGSKIATRNGTSSCQIKDKLKIL